MVFSLFKPKPLISLVLTKDISDKNGSEGLTQYKSLYTYESRLDDLQIKLQKIKAFSKKVIDCNNLSCSLARKEYLAQNKKGKCKKKKRAKLCKSKSMEFEDLSCGDQMTLNEDSRCEAECKEQVEEDALCKDNDTQVVDKGTQVEVTEEKKDNQDSKNDEYISLSKMILEECALNKLDISLDVSNKKQKKDKKISKASVSPTQEGSETKKASVVYIVQTPVREMLAMLFEEGRIRINTSEVYIQNSGPSSFNSSSNVLEDKTSEQETVISAMGVSDIFEIPEADNILSSNNPKVVNTSNNIILNKTNINKGTSETCKQKVVPLTHLRQETPQSNLLSSCYSIKPSEKNLICNSQLVSQCKVPKNSELVSFEEQNTQEPLILKLSEKEKTSITNVDRAINTEDRPLKTSNIQLRTLVTSKHHCINRPTEDSSKVKPAEYLSRLSASFCSMEKKSCNVISKTKKRKSMVRQLSSTDLFNKARAQRSTLAKENAGT